jgi:anaerobic ribonucleoside-triphosphate reductase activating protein
MNYHKYYPIDVINGPGTRATLFVAGCEHQCRGCYNQSTWRIDSGHPFTKALEDHIIADLNNPDVFHRGLSLSGGDPLHPANHDAILKLVKRVREECPGKDIWSWTGYELEQLTPAQRDIVELLDVLIDGKFVEELADPSLVWRGSSNQNIYYLRGNPDIPDGKIIHNYRQHEVIVKNL